MCEHMVFPQSSIQAFTAFGPTIIQPTWFCAREVFELGYNELYSKLEKVSSKGAR